MKTEIKQQAIYRVLIVDEDAAMREMLSEILRAPNRSVETCDTPRAALEFLQQNPIDVAFVDVRSGDASAQNLVNTIRKRCPHARVVICAGQPSQPWADAECTGKGERVLRQPFNFGKVLQLADLYTTE
jgi:two-component system, NtrC family, response regulator AlgB